MIANSSNNLSIKEYLEIESQTDTKYEYHNGSIYAMAGGMLNHGLICGNIFGEIRTALKHKKSNCKVLNSEIKLHIKEKNNFLYPDAMIICGEIEQAETASHAVTNPVVIIEVLSKSTANYDRGDKFFFYRQIETLQEYILIEQNKAQIEIYKKKGDLWKITRISGIANLLSISTLDIKIKLEDIYQDIVF
ncbi:MAG: Uma2 family endonuclease [Saprospiraceae bacterium]